MLCNRELGAFGPTIYSYESVALFNSSLHVIDKGQKICQVSLFILLGLDWTIIFSALYAISDTTFSFIESFVTVQDALHWSP